MFDHESAAGTLRRELRGAVHTPGTAGYDTHRVALNPRLDPRPAVVAEAVTPADVQAAVRVAGRYRLPLAVQATGHGTLVPADGGVLVRTTAMAEVLVNPARRIARVGPGATWADVIAAAAPFGLAPISGSSTSVGVAGFTFGGGVGWLSRRYGFAADNLVRADLVTADGDRVTANAERNPDLFWAIRGGGGNFGIATALEFRLHPVSRVYAGTAYFPLERARQILARFRDWSQNGQPDELAASVVLQASGLAIRGLYAGSAGDAIRALQPLWEVAGPPVENNWRATDYTESGTIGGTAPRQFELFEDLSEALIDRAVDAVAGPEPLANAIEVRSWGGAMARPELDAGPVGHRGVPFSFTVDGPVAASTRFAPYATGGSFLNFNHDPARTHTAYTTSDHGVLRDLKRAWDPDNVLGLTHNIAPSTIPARSAG
jgi:FAD/FMN-containing dehydrogenase